jgi:eukaryotic-like serine/threonine-protein kinase
LDEGADKSATAAAGLPPKDPRTRLQAIGDWGLLLDQDKAESESATTAPSRSRLGKAGWVAAVVFALAAIGVSAVHFREKPPAVYPTRFQIPLPDKGDFGTCLALSPDGHKVVFPTTGSEGRLWMRDLDSLELRLLPGTQNAVAPFWSPDSRFIGFGVGISSRKWM